MNTYPQIFRKKIVSGFLIVSICFLGAPSVFAQTEGELRDQIDTKSDEISRLESQLKKYQKDLEKIQGSTQSLQKEVQTANATLQQLDAQIQLTETKIDRTELSIEKNRKDLVRLSQEIGSHRTALGELIQSIREQDQASFYEFILSGDTVSVFFNELDKIEQIQTNIRGAIKKKQDASILIEAKQQELEKDIADLRMFKNQVIDQRKIAEQAKREKNDLLQKTQNEEHIYRNYITNLNQQKAQLDAEVRAYESQLKFILDTKSIPRSGSAPLTWPLSDIYITQRFGKTVDSKRLYASGTHSGVDFGAPVGTPLFALADGVVEGVGDTDTVCYRTSFGKFVFIRFQNGLAATYGHMSLAKVREGQPVKRGEVIGYSGNTGHSTGPHLHLSLYASRSADGTNAVEMKNRTIQAGACAGKTYRIPIAPINAYLDALAYLPPTNQSMFKPGAY